MVNPGGGSARIFNVDTTLPGTSEHATAVATVIAGSGDLSNQTPGAEIASPNSPKNQARGMAYECGVRSYDIVQDLAEMAALGAESVAGNLDIVFSNHSYGTSCGYQKPFGAAPNDPWLWYGDPGLGDGKVDYKLGFYLSDRSRSIDELVHSAEIYLPVWAAGNEGANFDPLESPEPMEAGKGFAVAHTVVQTGQTFTASNAPVRRSDAVTRRFTSSFGGVAATLGNLIPEACSKNVLTVGENIDGYTSVRDTTDDLRIKPDIVGAWGGSLSESVCALSSASQSSYRRFAGSSFAAASVTGGLALIRQRRKELFGAGTDLLASTWKGLAIATADGSAPTCESGFGTFDALEAIRLLEADYSGRSAESSARIMEIMLPEDRVSEFIIRRRFETDDVRVLICWSDPAGPELGRSIDPLTSVLINDIDLRIEDRSGSVFMPWRFEVGGSNLTSLNREQDDNYRDNVEVVDLDDAAEEMTVKIKAKNSTLLDGVPQQVSIVIAGDAEAVIPVFEIVDFSQTDPVNSNVFCVTWRSELGAAYEIETSGDLASWESLGGEFLAFSSVTSVPVELTGLGNRQFVRIRKID